MIGLSDESPEVLQNLMRDLGDFGPYQRWQYLLQVIAITLTAVHVYSLVTVAAVPEHRCEIKNVDLNGTMANLERSQLAAYIPIKRSGVFDSCFMYEQGTNKTKKCDSWVYSTEYHPSSRAIEWKFVCDRRWMSAVSQSTVMLGILIGNIVLGALADRIGRKPVFCYSALFSLVLGVGVAFTTDFYVFLGARFFLGVVAGAGSKMAGFVLTMELVGPRWRAAAGVGYQAFFAFGVMSVALWGAIIKDRQLLQVVYGLHAVPLMLHWWLLDESPRWLWAKGQREDSLKIIQKALKFNGSPKKLDIDQILLDDVKLNKKKDEKKINILDLFKRPNMRKRILIVGFCWFGNSLVYYGLSLSSRTMRGNPFLVIFLMGVLELPGYVIIIYLLDKVGRRFLTSFNMITSGLCCVLAVNLTLGSLTSNIFVYIGKFLIAASYSVIYIYSAELFPTMTRNSAVGFASMCARISGSLTPLIFLLDSFDPRIPSIIFGTITIFSGFMTCFLPETLGTSMPATIEEGENFGVGDTCFNNFLGRKNIIKYESENSDDAVIDQLEPLNNDQNV